MHLPQEELRLLPGAHAGHEEMICTPYEAILGSLKEIVVKVLVERRFSLCALDDNKPNRIAVNRRVAQLFPIDGSLIVRDIYTLHRIAVGIL